MNLVAHHMVTHHNIISTTTHLCIMDSESIISFSTCSYTCLYFLLLKHPLHCSFLMYFFLQIVSLSILQHIYQVFSIIVLHFLHSSTETFFFKVVFPYPFVEWCFFNVILQIFWNPNIIIFSSFKRTEVNSMNMLFFLLGTGVVFLFLWCCRDQFLSFVYLSEFLFYFTSSYLLFYYLYIY